MDEEVRQKLISFFSKYKKINFLRGEPLILADKNPGGVFYLVYGVVKEYAVSIKGTEVVLNLYKPDSFFPLNRVFNETTSPHYFEAMTDLRVWKAPSEEFLKFLKQEPDILLDLIRRINKGMEGMFLRLEYAMSGSASQKFICELLIFAKRFGKQEGLSVKVDFKIFEKDLASQTGIARETVSRIIHKLKEKKLIDFKGNHILVRDMQKLEEELTLS